MEKLQLDNLMEFTETFTLKRLADMPDVQINLVCLPPGFSFPAHSTDSNVRLLVLMGEVTATVEGTKNTLAVHEMIAVSFGTLMQIANESGSNTAFLVVKTPNPSERG